MTKTIKLAIWKFLQLSGRIVVSFFHSKLFFRKIALSKVKAYLPNHQKDFRIKRIAAPPGVQCN